MDKGDDVDDEDTADTALSKDLFLKLVSVCVLLAFGIRICKNDAPGQRSESGTGIETGTDAEVCVGGTYLL